jgi:glc operon protein GlcG
MSNRILISFGIVAAFCMTSAVSAQELDTRRALTLDAAKAMAAACIEYAEARERTINVWIYDVTGNPIYFHRMDGAAIVGMETSRRKGITALKSGATSGEVDLLFEDAGIAGGLIAIQSDWMGNPGGVPVIVDGHLIGSVGAGGMGQQPDHECASTAANVVIPADQRPAD